MWTLFLGILLGLAIPPFFKWVVELVTKKKDVAPVVAALMILALTSCGGAGKAPDDYITFGLAFSHVVHSFSYWLWLVLSLIPTVVYLITYYRGKIDQVDLRLLFLFVALIFFAALMRPCEVAANTTVEQAARGVWLGY